MEQKKLLWVLVAVSGFLILVFGFAMILYSQGRDAAPALHSASTPATALSSGVTPSDRTGTGGFSATPNPDAAQGQGGTGLTGPGMAGQGQPLPAGQAMAQPQGTGSNPVNVTIVNGQNASANFTTLDVSGLTSDTGTAVIAVPQGGAPTTPTTGPAATEGQVKAVTPAETTPRVQTVTAPTATAKTTTAKPAASVSKAPVTTTSKTPVTVTEYWIQTGSFSGKLNAEKARDTLKARYLNAEIFTKAVSGSTAYRVRVGPYAKKSEADYWLSVVREIAGFSDSYVSEVKTKR